MSADVQRAVVVFLVSAVGLFGLLWADHDLSFLSEDGLAAIVAVVAGLVAFRIK